MGSGGKEPVPQTVPDPQPDSLRPAAWPGLAVAILFGLFYAYDLFEAIANLVGMATGLADKALVPWVALILGVVVPPAGFVVAWWLGRRRRVAVRVVIFLAGLAVTAAVSLSLESYVVTLFR